MSQRPPAKFGFTLIEILVSVTIFALLIGIAMASYLNLSQALKKQNIQRRLYSELARIMEDTDRWGKFFTIDYEWYGSTGTPVNPQSGNEHLALISKDGKARIHLAEQATPDSPVPDNWLGIYKEVRDESGNWQPDTGFIFQQFERLTSAELQIQHAQFFIFPAPEETLMNRTSSALLENPPALSAPVSEISLAAPFQPKVTMVLTGGMLNPFAKNTSGTGADGRFEKFNLQTSFSIRPYSSSLAP